MTTAPERPAARRSPTWDECSLLPDHGGVRWWLAVSLALALTAAGVFADVQRQGRLGIAFHACYFLGCLLAVVAVQRKAVFGPMVQPPLILAIAVPGVVMLAGSVPTGGGAAATALAVGTPLINGFPAMAITTVVTLAVGAFRLRTQRQPGSPTTQSRRSADPTTKSRRNADPPAEPPGKPARTPAAERARKPSPRPVRTANAEPFTEPIPKMTEQPPRRRRRPQP